MDEEENASYQNDLLKFQHGFILSKLAYKLNKNDKSCTVFDADGVEREYIVEYITGVSPGLNGFILVGNDSDNPNVYVTFRGTYDLDGVWRDVEISGPGVNSFAKNEDTIIERIEAAVEKTQQRLSQHSDKRATLGFYGHSLGGSDAQKCTAAVLQAMAQFNNRTPLNKIDTINISFVNSAGVSHYINKVCQTALKKVTTINKNFKINYFPIMVKSDPLQKAGETSILVNADPNYVNIKLLNISINKFTTNDLSAVSSFFNKIKRATKAFNTAIASHTFRIFAENYSALQNDVTAVVYDNQKKEDRKLIDQLLARKINPKLGAWIARTGTLMKKTNRVINNVTWPMRSMAHYYGRSKDKLKPTEKQYVNLDESGKSFNDKETETNAASSENSLHKIKNP